MRTHWPSYILWLYVILMLLFIFAPVISLIAFSFHAGKVQSFPIEQYSLHWYVAALNNSDIRDGLRNSLVVGVTVSVMSVILGFSSAYVVCRRTEGSGLAYIAFVSLPVVVPLLLSGMASFIYFQYIHISGTLWAIIVAHTCLCSPFAFVIIRNPYDRLNTELEYAAGNLGAGQWRVILEIVIPQLWPAIAAAALLSFLVSWDEFILAWFVGGFTKTLPVVIYGMMGTSFNASLNAVGTLNMLISSCLLCGAFLLVRRHSRMSRKKP